MREFTKQNLDPDWWATVGKFPKIFLEPSDYVQDLWERRYKQDGVDEDDLVNLRYGFEHGFGWKDIVEGFCADMQALADKAKANGHVYQYKGCIIKEKFGMFTPQGDIYSDVTDPEIKNLYNKECWDIVLKWEQKSLTTCESCGKEGKLNGRGWVKVRCKECAKP